MARRPRRPRPPPEPELEPAPPPTPSFWKVVKYFIINNRTVISIGLAVVVGLPSIVAAVTLTEPWQLATHGWTRGQVAPDHNYIVYLKLEDAKKALKDAKAELAKDPNSITAEKAIQYYEDIIKKYKTELDKAAGQ